MKKKSLNVQKINHNFIIDCLKDRLINSIYRKFKKNLNPKENYIVAVSGGPDSLALAFFAKCYSKMNNANFYYYLVDHKLRKDSSEEAKTVVKLLKKIDVNCKVLNWRGNKPNSNIQSIARFNRYSLLVKECNKLKSKNIILGHHIDDLNENFLMRMMRGSGLKGLVSMGQTSCNYNVKFLRPLINIEKKRLKQVSLKVFKSYINDPSNNDEKFKRIRVRNLIKKFESEGLDKKKLNLTITNLKSANDALEFYKTKNILKNSFYNLKNNNAVLSKNFFIQPDEIILRSITKIIQKISKKYYPPRGKSIKKLIEEIKFGSEVKKLTLGGCIFKKVNETIIIIKE